MIKDFKDNKKITFFCSCLLEQIISGFYANCLVKASFTSAKVDFPKHESKQLKNSLEWK